MTEPRAFDAAEVAKFEHAVWSRCAKGYADGFGALVSDAIAPLLDAGSVSQGRRVLDVGTGPGLVAAAVMTRGGDAVGIDFSEAMLVEARQRYPRIEFRQASADSLPFGEGTFDAVVSNFVVHHLGRPDKALEEMFRVLKKCGRVVFTVWGDLSKLEAFGLFFAAVEQHGNPGELPHGPLFGVSDFDVFHRMVRDAGFHDSAIRELPIAWRMSSIDSLLAAFRDWAQMDAFPEALQTAIEATVRDKARAYESHGMLTIPNPAILVSAVK
jgi:SAM-dependent methyltransferase